MGKPIEVELSYSETRIRLRALEKQLSDQLGLTPLRDERAHSRLTSELTRVRTTLDSLDASFFPSGPADLIGHETRKQSHGPEPRRFRQGNNE